MKDDIARTVPMRMFLAKGGIFIYFPMVIRLERRGCKGDEVFQVTECNVTECNGVDTPCPLLLMGPL